MSHDVNNIPQDCKSRRQRLLDNLCIKRTHVRFVRQIQSQFFLNSSQVHQGVHLAVVIEVRHRRIHHEQQEREEQRVVSTKNGIRREGVNAERGEIFSLDAAHRLDHLLVQFHRRRQRLRIFSEDEAEIDVQQSAVLRDKQILQVSIADAEKVRDDTVAGAGLEELLLLGAMKVLCVGFVLDAAHQVRVDRLFLHVLESFDVGDEFDESLHRACGENAIRSEVELKSVLTEEKIGELDDLDDELILADIIAVLEHDFEDVADFFGFAFFLVGSSLLLLLLIMERRCFRCCCIRCGSDSCRNCGSE